MVKRHLASICFADLFGRQMRFIAGPRQVGKTTLAKKFLESKDLENLYFNWDLRDTRNKYKLDPYFFETAVYDSKKESTPPWLCLDEIHKMPKWKNILKDYFDKFEDECRFVVTGSARLDWFKKSGDSLAGRYFLFKLFPFSLSEVTGMENLEVSENESAEAFIERKISHGLYRQDALDHLLKYSGFPEPYLKADERFHRRWKRDMTDRLVREDIRDLTKIIDTENIVTLFQLLPERVGSPLSVNALKEDMSVSYNAVKTAITAMRLIYTIFFVPPYSEKIARSIKKEKKCYYFDWTRCDDFAKRFENYVAVELKSMVELWNDAGIAEFDLFYVRTRDGKETDFLVTRNGAPWCSFEVKAADRAMASHHYKHSQVLGDIPVVQLTHQDGILKKNDNRFYRISAGRFF